MEEKKEELWQLMLEMTFDDKATYEKMMNAVNEATGKHGFVNYIGYGKVKGFDVKSDDKKLEAFQPQKGDICTCIIDDNVDAIFRYDGKTRTDENGVVWLYGDLDLTWSGDLFKPYMIIRGVDTEYNRDCCRAATEEEINLFSSKIKELAAEQGNKGKEEMEHRRLGVCGRLGWRMLQRVLCRTRDIRRYEDHGEPCPPWMGVRQGIGLPSRLRQA